MYAYLNGANGGGFVCVDETKAIAETVETAKIAVSVGDSFIAHELAEAFVLEYTAE